MAAPSESWQSWLDAHGPALLMLARHLTDCAADAEDAFQDGFVRFWNQRARSPGLLYAAVRSAALDLRRRSVRRAARQRAVAVADVADSADAQAMAGERRVAIEAALSPAAGGAAGGGHHEGLGRADVWGHCAGCA